MPIYKRNAYTPPSFHLFQKKGFGFLDLGAGAVNLSEGSVRYSVQELEKGWGNKDVSGVVDLYSNWTEADDFLRRLMSMSDQEREKHLKLDQKYELDKIMDRHAKVGAMIKQLEAERPEALADLLDAQLKQALEEWLGYLAWAKDHGLEHDDESPDPMTSFEDFFSKRDDLEYARIGLRENRLDGRLQQLTFFDEFDKRLRESDKLFEAVLDGKRGHRFWTDPTFWWHEHEPPMKNDPAMMATPWDND